MLVGTIHKTGWPSNLQNSMSLDNSIFERMLEAKDSLDSKMKYIERASAFIREKYSTTPDILRWLLPCIALWFALVIAVSLTLSAIGFEIFQNKSVWYDPKAEISVKLEQIQNIGGVLAVLIGSFVGAVSLGNSLTRTALQDKTQKNNEDRLNSDTFASAIQLLSDNRQQTRMGAIFILEGLLKLDQARLQKDRMLTRQVAETLAAFIRNAKPRGYPDDPPEGAEWETGKRPRNPAEPDVEAAFMVLARSYHASNRPE